MIYSFITSVQCFINQPFYLVYGPFCRINGTGPVYYCIVPTWNWLTVGTYSLIEDINHIRVFYFAKDFTWLYELESVHIIFCKNGYETHELYPYRINYTAGFIFDSNYIPDY